MLAGVQSCPKWTAPSNTEAAGIEQPAASVRIQRSAGLSMCRGEARAGLRLAGRRVGDLADEEEGAGVVVADQHQEGAVGGKAEQFRSEPARERDFGERGGGGA